MSDDELIERLRRTLDTEAARIDAPEDAWERFQAAAPPPAPQHHRNRRLWLGAPSAVVGLAAAILIAVLVTHGSAGHPTQVATPEVRGAASATTSVPSAGPAAAAGGPEAASAPSTVTSPLAPTAGGAEAHLAPGAFSPRSVTFVSPSEGWVLGNTGIEHTVDGGRTWSPVGAAPSSDATHLRFADPSDGWAWSSSTVWSTHDGGRTWTRQTLPGLATEFTVEDLQASAGVAHVAVTQDDGSVRILTTPVGSDAWRLSPAHITLGAGPVPSGQLVLQGSVGWFIQVDRTVVAGARLVNGQWQPWTPPCLNANGPAVLAASSPTELVAACDQGVWGPAAPMGEQLSVSHDGGATWTDAGGVPAQPAQAVASASSATIVAAGTGGLEATFDAGRSWATVVPVNGNEVTDLGFTTATQGVAVVNGHGPAGVLLMTRDGGHTWNPVTFP